MVCIFCELFVRHAQPRRRQRRRCGAGAWRAENGSRFGGDQKTQGHHHRRRAGLDEHDDRSAVRVVVVDDPKEEEEEEHHRRRARIFVDRRDDRAPAVVRRGRRDSQK